MKRGARSRLILKLTLCTLAGAVVTWGTVVLPALAPSLSARRLDWYNRVTSTAVVRSTAETCYRRSQHRVGQAPPGFGDPAELLDEVRHDTYSERPPMISFAPASRRSLWTATLRGMPFRCAWGWECEHDSSITTPGVLTRSGWLSVGGYEFTTRILPLGFTLNTLLAAGVLLGVVEGFAFARRRVRRAKGRCAACGYDRGGIAGDAACPECGKA
jgi:hypothetical protein